MRAQGSAEPPGSLTEEVSFELSVCLWKEPVKGTALGGKNKLGLFGDSIPVTAQGAKRRRQQRDG